MFFCGKSLYFFLFIFTLESATKGEQNSTMFSYRGRVFTYLTLKRKPIQGQIQVFWDINAGYANREDIAYKLSYKYTKIGDCQPVINPYVIKVFTVDHQVRSYEIMWLKAWYTVTVIMKARTTEYFDYNYDLDVLEQSVLTQDEAPTGKVSDITTDIVGSTNAELSWQPPTCAERGGFKKGYDVEFAPSSVMSDIKTIRTVTEMIKLEKLQPYTKYQVRIRYLNGYSPGPFSDPFYFWTSEAIPSAPNFYNYTYDDINIGLLIFQPVKPNGKILQYQLQISGGRLGQVNLYTPVNGSHYIIDGLTPNTTYSIRMRAQNGAGWGHWSPIHYITTGYETDISSTYLRQTMANSTCIGVTWGRPSLLSGWVYQYKVEVCLAIDENRAKTKMVHYYNNQTFYGIQCGLQPCNLYQFLLSVVQLGGHVGLPIVARFWTGGCTPPKPKRPIIKETTDKTISVKVFPVTFLKGPITAYDIRLLDLGPRHVGNDSEPNTLSEEEVLDKFGENAGRLSVPQKQPSLIPVNKRSIGIHQPYLNWSETKFVPRYNDMIYGTIRLPVLPPRIIPGPFGMDREYNNLLRQFYEWKKNTIDKRVRTALILESSKKGHDIFEGVEFIRFQSDLVKRKQYNFVSGKKNKRYFNDVKKMRKRTKRSSTNGGLPGIQWLEVKPSNVSSATVLVVKHVEPATEYVVIFVVESTIADVTRHSFSVSTTTAVTKDSEESDEHWPSELFLILVILLPLLFLILFCCLGFFIIRWLIKKRFSSEENTKKAEDKDDKPDKEDKEHNDDLINFVDEDDDDEEDDNFSAYDGDDSHRRDGSVSKISGKRNSRVEQFFNRTNTLDQPRYIPNTKDRTQNNNNSEDDGCSRNNNCCVQMKYENNNEVMNRIQSSSSETLHTVNRDSSGSHQCDCSSSESDISLNDSNKHCYDGNMNGCSNNSCSIPMENKNNNTGNKMIQISSCETADSLNFDPYGFHQVVCNSIEGNISNNGSNLYNRKENISDGCSNNVSKSGSGFTLENNNGENSVISFVDPGRSCCVGVDGNANLPLSDLVCCDVDSLDEISSISGDTFCEQCCDEDGTVLGKNDDYVNDNNDKVNNGNDYNECDNHDDSNDGDDNSDVCDHNTNNKYSEYSDENEDKSSDEVVNDSCSTVTVL